MTAASRGVVRAGWFLAIAALAFAPVPASPQAQEVGFPHAAHEGLFPVCSGCHQGVEAADSASFYPAPALCAQCHDGVREETVAWTRPSHAPTNVVFDHVVHAASLTDAGDPPQACDACHSQSGGGRMAVDAREELEACWSCHAHETEDHFATNAECETCHVPLAATGFDRSRIAALPRPSSHQSPLYLPEAHARLAPGYADRCATCHTADRCLSCHVDGTLLAIEGIPRAPPGMELPAAAAEYPTPGSHMDEGWLDGHQVQAPVRECSTCHTADDCRTCHVGLVPSVVEALPRRDQTLAPGVGLVPRPPSSHLSGFFLEAHAVLASSDTRSCLVCHEDTYCVACHDGPPLGGYHPSSFVARHAAEGFARVYDCATCHSTEVFCRACHMEVGLSSAGRAGAAYHDGSPLWLLRHGQAARQSLESCASCHRQSDCVRCHGVLGAFSVSPHTRSFDAERAWARSPRTCLGCHVSNPVGSDGAP